MTKLERTTDETRIELELDAATPRIETPDAFLTHMLDTLGRHAGLGLRLKAASRDGVDHHLVEDAALALGRALRPRTEGAAITRFGERLLAMDDALVAVALDTGGRPYYEGELPLPLYEHFLRSLAFEAAWTLHVDVRRGRDPHHVVEGAFKAVAMALRDALEPAPRLPSAKGKVSYRGG